MKKLITFLTALLSLSPASLIYQSEMLSAKEISEVYTPYLHGKPQIELDELALDYCLTNPNTHMAFIFQPLDGIENELKIVISKYVKIIHEKKIYVKNEGPINLTMLMYEGRTWLGNEKNAFYNAVHNAQHRFTQNNTNGVSEVHIFVFEAESLEKVVHLKKRIRRSFFDNGTSCIHSNDFHRETCLIAQGLLTPNALHFINFAKRTYRTSLESLVSEFKEYILNQGLDINNFCLAENATLMAYGLRESSSLDFVHTREIKSSDLSSNKKFKDISHNLKHYPLNADDLLSSSKNYFFFKGVKFVSLNNVKALKKARHNEEDTKDLKAIAKLK